MPLQIFGSYRPVISLSVSLDSPIAWSGNRIGLTL